MNDVRKKNGFTLMEIMIVIAILAILVMAALASLTNSQARSRDLRRKSDLRQVASALELYYNDYGTYPTTGGSNTIVGCGTTDVDGCAATGTCDCAWSASSKFVAKTGNAVYMAAMPKDPGSNSYKYELSGSGYRLYARLENQCDVDVPKDSSTNYSQVYTLGSGASCGTLKCNFTISSPNLSPNPVAENPGSKLCN